MQLQEIMNNSKEKVIRPLSWHVSYLQLDIIGSLSQRLYKCQRMDSSSWNIRSFHCRLSPPSLSTAAHHLALFCFHSPSVPQWSESMSIRKVLTQNLQTFAHVQNLVCCLWMLKCTHQQPHDSFNIWCWIDGHDLRSMKQINLFIFWNSYYFIHIISENCVVVHNNKYPLSRCHDPIMLFCNIFKIPSITAHQQQQKLQQQQQQQQRR